ncbi:protein ORAOV1 homolog [Agrilus planipennis]|uniref:Protein ORAOV1 homolog n=1 Tax=Agrilus planipennis TaxID=224129 RepID=A0A7F5R8M7_AGRPL|nr:protein ORAOV1 homolog [Agrilus planipennis]
MCFTMNKDKTGSEEKCDTKDINEVFDDLFLLEDRYVKQGYQEGYCKGSTEDNIEAFHLGYHRGAELGAELGYYSAVIEVYLEQIKQGFECPASVNIIKNIETLKEAIDSFPTSNIQSEDILGLADRIRTLFKKVCALLKLKISYPEGDKMSF